MTRDNWQKWIPKAKEAIDFYDKEFDVKPLVRMVFYHLTRFGLPNSTYAYKYFDRLLVKARRSGDFPWGAFAEDQARQTGGGDYSFQTPEQAVDSALNYLFQLPNYYKLPIWYGQPTQVLIIVEKTGERDVFVSLTKNWNVLVVPCRGYGAWESLKSLIDKLNSNSIAIFYFGDFDPSGEDIPRFIEDAVKSLGVVPLEFTKLAVTKPQVDQFKLPHKPEDEKEIQKLLRDPRYKNWSHGLFRVETEALLGVAPDYIRELLDKSIAKYFDTEEREEAIRVEEKLRQEVAEEIEKLKQKLK